MRSRLTRAMRETTSAAYVAALIRARKAERPEEWAAVDTLRELMREYQLDDHGRELVRAHLAALEQQARAGELTRSAGRPARSAAGAASGTELRVRMTRGEIAELDRRAAAANLDRSAYVRARCLS